MGILSCQKTSYTLEYKPCLSGKKVERNNECVLDSFLIILHTWNKSSWFQESTDIWSLLCWLVQEMASTVNFKSFISLRSLGQCVKDNSWYIGGTYLYSKVKHVDEFCEEFSEELFQFCSNGWIFGSVEFLICYILCEFFDLERENGQESMN